MNLGFQSSISGIKASSLQIAVSASNVSRAPVLGAQPQRVVQSTSETSGVIATVQNNQTADSSIFNEFHQNNIDLAQEFVNQSVASFAFMSNVKALNASMTTLGSLLDMNI